MIERAYFMRFDIIMARSVQCRLYCPVVQLKCISDTRELLLPSSGYSALLKEAANSNKRFY
jgi:hypothetical protein